MNSKPRRAQGGKGLLSQSISVQESQESIPKRGGRKSTERERGAPARRKGEACCWASSGALERGEG